MFTTPTPLRDPTPSSRFAVISNGGSDWLLYDRLAGQECVVCSTPNYSLIQRARAAAPRPRQRPRAGLRAGGQAREGASLQETEHGLVTERPRNEGVLVLTADRLVRHIETGTKRGFRSLARTYKKIPLVRRDKLTVAQQRKAEHQEKLLAAALHVATDTKEIAS